MSDIEILALVKSLREENAKLKVQSTSKWWVSPTVSILVIIVGIAINWGVVTASISHLEKVTDSNTTRVFDNQLTIINLDRQYVEIKTRSTIMLDRISKDVDEIKNEVKKMSRRRY